MKSASPDLGSAPGSMNQNTASNQSEAMKQLLVVLEKKVRNMEKKKVTLLVSLLSSLIVFNKPMYETIIIYSEKHIMFWNNILDFPGYLTLCDQMNNYT